MPSSQFDGSTCAHELQVGTTLKRKKMAATLSSLFAFFKSFPRIATVLLWVLLVACVDAQNRSGEVQTLLRFKTVMEPDSAMLAIGYWSTWKATDENPCDWYGVSCTANFTVEQLDFLGWGLTQQLSFKLLSNLTDLRELDLSFNDFIDQTSGSLNPGISIPDDVGSLIKLTRLVMSNSKFVGPIPSTISACRNLRYLSLEFNQLTGEIPDLSSLTNLQYLLLRNNQLSGPFPLWLGQLNSLLVVELTQNSFNGTIPSLSNPNLLEVLLDNNFFTGFQEPIFPGAKSFQHLSVASNQLEGPIPVSITGLKNLRILDLSANQLSGPIPSNFSLNMSQPVDLTLSHNQLTGSIPANLLQPTIKAFNAPILNFSHNLLTGPIPLDATKQYNYFILDFSNNSLSGNIPSICKTGNTYVEYLHFENNNLSGDILEFFVECYDHITEMRLANNSFSGDLSKIDYISASLDLAMRVANLKDGVRDLSNNNLQMTTPEANPNPLRAVLEFFVLNTSLLEFRIQGNNFSGTPLPADFNLSASSLQVLDLSNSHLTGEISGAAFNSTWFPALQSLYLSNNDITGPIPEAIVMLPNLAVLDLAANGLSGRLPFVPASLSPNLFPGNRGLCGDPLRTCSGGIGVQWWVLLIAIGGSVAVAVGSCLLVTWRWRKYRKMHQQDADLIKTLLERESASLMSLRELKKATNNFAESAQIGKGGFGIVYTGKLQDGTAVAIKRSNREGSESDKDRFLNEVKILSQINHRHLVKLLGCCMENRIALLVFEFVSNGTLQEHLQGKVGAKRLSWNQRLLIAVQTADALNYLHSAATFPIYHRDVKSANILIDGDLNAKVADFGISKLVPLEVTHVSTVAIQGTLGYIDPEYYTSYQLNDKSDVYSFGVVLLELISGKPAIDFLRGGDNTGLVSFAKPYIESGDLEELIDVALVDTYNDLAYHGRESILNVGRLGMKCLHMQSQERPTMHNVWKELQNLRFEFQGSSTDFGSIKNDGNKDSLHDHIILLSDSISCNSSSFSLPNDPTSVQMSLRYPD